MEDAGHVRLPKRGEAWERGALGTARPGLTASSASCHLGKTLDFAEVLFAHLLCGLLGGFSG